MDVEIPEIAITVSPQVSLLTVDTATYSIAVSQDVTQIVSVAQQGPMGPPGSASTAVFPFAVPALTWTVAHFLGRYPAVTILDTANEVILATYQYVDRNVIEVSFGAPTNGTVYLT
jgi:hypothetical protein